MQLVLVLGAVALAGLLLAHGVVAARFAARAGALAYDLGGPAVPARPDRLPPMVRDFALRGLAGAEPAGSLRLTQAAEMQLKPGSAWMPIAARQTIATARPGFVWFAVRRIGPVPLFTVIDAFVRGHGHLEARAFGSIRVAHATGPDMDRGEAMRYLAELPWSPDAILANDSIGWAMLGDDRVEASLEMPEGKVSVHFGFLDGDIVKMTAADRPSRRPDGTTALLPWQASFADYAAIGARRIPRRGEVGYVIDGTYSPYWRGRIETLEAHDL